MGNSGAKEKDARIFVRGFEDLPIECMRLLKDSELRQEEAEEHFEVLLNILHYKTKKPLAVKGAAKLKKPDPLTPEESAAKKKIESKFLQFESELPSRKKHRSRYQAPKELAGKGGYGRVFNSTVKETGEPCAIKIMAQKTERLRQRNARECYFLYYCDHKNICKYIDSFLVKVTELMEGGTLQEAVRCHDFTETQIAFVAQAVLNALVYLHSENIVHRDLKSANIMLTYTGEVKLIDFGNHLPYPKGLAYSTLQTPQTRHMAGSPYWMAPEMIKKQFYGPAIDIWSLGICLIELANDHPPYHGDGIKAMFVAATRGCPDLVSNERGSWTEDFVDFLESCLKLDPEGVGSLTLTERPTAVMLLEHPLNTSAASPSDMGKLVKSIFTQKETARQLRILTEDD